MRHTRVTENRLRVHALPIEARKKSRRSCAVETTIVEAQTDLGGVGQKILASGKTRGNIPLAKPFKMDVLLSIVKGKGVSNESAPPSKLATFTENSDAKRDHVCGSGGIGRRAGLRIVGNLQANKGPSLSPHSVSDQSVRSCEALRGSNGQSLGIQHSILDGITLCEPLTKEDLARFKQQAHDEKRNFEAEVAKMRREALREFRACCDLKLLADRLGVAKIITASSTGAEGQYLQPDSSTWPTFGDWDLSERRTAHINGITSGKNKAVILIDVLQAHLGERKGVPAVLAHEIGHHIDYLAHGKFTDFAPKQRFLSAFKRAGFYANPITQCEFIAETLGNYLLGTQLPATLLAEVKQTLDKLSREYLIFINEFRPRDAHPLLRPSNRPVLRCRAIGRAFQSHI
jgi:hypothetical protein